MFVSESGQAFDLRYQYRYEFSGGFILYEGVGMPSANKSGTGWVIRKHTNNGSQITSVSFADQSTAFDKVWNNRADYSYL